jgi:hypothetical protein
MDNKNEIKSEILSQKLIDWKKLNFIQETNFKELKTKSFNKLIESIKENGFICPFYVWDDGKKIWCLDGYHRKLTMQHLIREGFSIPDKLPAVFINCRDKKHASSLVLVYSSIFARITMEGLSEFIVVNDLSFPDLKSTIDIPELNINEFERGYITPSATKPPTGNESNDDPDTQSGDTIFFGEHKLKVGKTNIFWVDQMIKDFESQTGMKTVNKRLDGDIDSTDMKLFD